MTYYKHAANNFHYCAFLVYMRAPVRLDLSGSYNLLSGRGNETPNFSTACLDSAQNWVH